LGNSTHKVCDEPNIHDNGCPLLWTGSLTGENVNNTSIKSAASSQSSLPLCVLPAIQMVPAFLIRVEDERLQVHKRSIALHWITFCHVSLNLNEECLFFHIMLTGSFKRVERTEATSEYVKVLSQYLLLRLKESNEILKITVFCDVAPGSLAEV
jgi:hypothetical protein